MRDAVAAWPEFNYFTAGYSIGSATSPCFGDPGFVNGGAAAARRQIALVAFLQAQNCSNYPTSWRHPEHSYVSRVRRRTARGLAPQVRRTPGSRLASEILRLLRDRFEVPERVAAATPYTACPVYTP